MQGGYGAYGGVPGQRYQPFQPPPPTPPPFGTKPPDVTWEQVVELAFYWPIESLRIAGDNLRVLQAGIWIATGGDPYVPDLHSDYGKRILQVRPGDSQGNLQLLKEQEFWNFENGLYALSGKAVAEVCTSPL